MPRTRQRGNKAAQVNAMLGVLKGTQRLEETGARWLEGGS